MQSQCWACSHCVDAWYASYCSPVPCGPASVWCRVSMSNRQLNQYNFVLHCLLFKLYFVYFPVVCLSVSFKWLAVKNWPRLCWVVCRFKLHLSILLVLTVTYRRLGCPLMLRSVIYLYQYITQKITLLGCLATSDVTIIALTNTQLESWVVARNMCDAACCLPRPYFTWTLGMMPL